MLTEEWLPLLHGLVQAVVPRRTGDDERDLLAAFAIVYQCAATPEAYSLFAWQCESRAGIPNADTEVARAYRDLAQLAHWRAAGLEQRG